MSFGYSDVRQNLILATFAALALFASLGPDSILAQQDSCIEYETVVVDTPVMTSKLVTETVYDTREVVDYRPVLTLETRQRTVKTLEPVVQTREREERYIVMQPVTETKYRERTIEETTMEKIVEMRKEQYEVENPVIETRMREEQIRVRRPVTETKMQIEERTALRPVTQSTTELVPVGRATIPQTVQGRRRAIRWIPRGYYNDPVNGGITFRPAGFHWVTPEQCTTCTEVQLLAAQRVDRTTLVPETIRVEKPIDITKYIDELETRQIPVQVQTTRKETKTREIPVTVFRPRTKIKIERIPFEAVTFKRVEKVRRIPYTETTFKEVVTTEPYQVEVQRWQEFKRQVQVPRTVTRCVQVPSTKRTSRIVAKRVNRADSQFSIGQGSTLNQNWTNGTRIRETSGRSDWADESVNGIPLVRRRVLKERIVDGPLPSDDLTNVQLAEKSSSRKSIMVPSLDSSMGLNEINLIPIRGKSNSVANSDDSSGDSKSIIETGGRQPEPADRSPELEPYERQFEKQGTNISDSVPDPIKVEMPAATPNGTGDDSADRRPATMTPAEPETSGGPAIGEPASDDPADVIGTNN